MHSGDLLRSPLCITCLLYTSFFMKRCCPVSDLAGTPVAVTHIKIGSREGAAVIDVVGGPAKCDVGMCQYTDLDLISLLLQRLSGNLFAPRFYSRILRRDICTDALCTMCSPGPCIDAGAGCHPIWEERDEVNKDGK